MNKPNIIGGIMGIALSTYVFFTANQFPTTPNTQIGPGYFPAMLALALFLLSSFLLIQALLKKDKEDFEKFDIKSPELIRSGLSLVATVAYAFLMQILGFIVATFFYLLFLMHLLKNRKYKKMVIISVLVSIAVYMVFKNVLHLTLPSGLFI